MVAKPTGIDSPVDRSLADCKICRHLPIVRHDVQAISFIDIASCAAMQTHHLSLLKSQLAGTQQENRSAAYRKDVPKRSQEAQTVAFFPLIIWFCQLINKCPVFKA